MFENRIGYTKKINELFLAINQTGLGITRFCDFICYLKCYDDGKEYDKNKYALYLKKYEKHFYEYYISHLPMVTISAQVKDGFKYVIKQMMNNESPYERSAFAAILIDDLKMLAGILAPCKIEGSIYYNYLTPRVADKYSIDDVKRIVLETSIGE